MREDAPRIRTRAFVMRWLAVGAVGVAILAGILYYASTVDARPPSVTQFGLTQHLTGNNEVALTNASLQVVFSEQVDHPSAQTALHIKPAVQGAFSWSGATMTFTPRFRLPLKTTFVARVGAGVRDTAGNLSGPSAPFTFHTVGEPRVVASQPSAGAFSVPLTATVRITFSTLMDTASVERTLNVVPHTEVDLRWSGEQLTIVPRGELLPSRRYFVIIGTGATDLAGAALAPEFDLAFQTVDSKVAVRTAFPADGTLGAAVTTPVAIIFDRAIDPGSVSGGIMALSPSVAGSLSVVALDGAAGMHDSERRVLRFTPSGGLPPNTTFQVRVAPGLRAADGSELVEELRWTFTTGAPSATLGNQIVFISDRSGLANLWAMNPDGSNQRELSAELSPITAYAAAPDGRTFVVGDGARLIELNADGTGRRVLTESGVLEFDPTYAPDGSRIAFARADRASGAGLGLWQRPVSGGAAQAIPLPVAASPPPTASGAEVTISPSPLASASGAPSASPSGSPLLRAPRYSPDGTLLAFADSSGTIGIVDLAHDSLTRAPFQAASPPAWLPDGAAILVSGHQVGQAGASPVAQPGIPVAPFDPDGLALDAAARASMSIVRLDAGNGSGLQTILVGAGLPAVGSDGEVAYLRYEPSSPPGWRVYAAPSDASGEKALSPDAVAIETSVSFGPEPDTLLVSRALPFGPPAQPSPTPVAASSPSLGTASGGSSLGVLPTPFPAPGPNDPEGIWLVTVDGGVHQLTHDGRMPRWLP